MVTKPLTRAEKNRINGKLGGRPKGTKTAKTLEKDRVMEAFRQRAMKMSGILLMSQAQEAIGTYQIIRKDKIYNRKGKTASIKWTVVSDSDEIETVVNEFGEMDGKGEIDGKYYMVVQDKPNYRASDAILNRALGKPVETLDLGNKDNQPFIIKMDT